LVWAAEQASWRGVFFKATQGTAGVDPMFVARWRAAGALGLARGAYHYAESADNGALDFDHFIGVVIGAGKVTDRDVLCLDSEDTAAAARADEHAREFTARAEARGFPEGCLYTGRWYADPANLRPDDLAPGWRRLWVSDYGTAADSAVELPAGWSRDQVFIRQYTDAETIAGIAGPCDANRVLKEWISMPLTDADAALIAAKLTSDHNFLFAIRKELITALADPTHHYLQDELQPLKDGVDRLGKTLDTAVAAAAVADPRTAATALAGLVPRIRITLDPPATGP
jgi:lysozyme